MAPTILDLGGGQQSGFLPALLGTANLVSDIRGQRERLGLLGRQQALQEQEYQSNLELAREKLAMAKAAQEAEMAQMQAEQQRGALMFQKKLEELGIGGGLGAGGMGPPDPNAPQMSPETRQWYEQEAALIPHLSPRDQQRRMQELDAERAARQLRDDTRSLLSDTHEGMNLGAFSTAEGQPVDPEVKQEIDGILAAVEAGEVHPLEGRRMIASLRQSFADQRAKATMQQMQMEDMQNHIGNLRARVQADPDNEQYEQDLARALSIFESFRGDPGNYRALSREMRSLSNVKEPGQQQTTQQDRTRFQMQKDIASVYKGQQGGNPFLARAQGNTDPAAANAQRKKEMGRAQFDLEGIYGQPQTALVEIRQMIEHATMQGIPLDQTKAAVEEYALSLGIDPAELPDDIQQALSKLKPTMKPTKRKGEVSPKG